MVNKNYKSALFFIQNGLGGAERITIEIAKMLITDGWSIQMAVICTNGVTDISRIESFFPKKATSSKIPREGQISFLRNLYHEIKTYNPTVVFASAMHINQRLLLLSPLFKKTKFIVRNDNYLYTLPRYKRLTLGLTYRLADEIIAQTEEMDIELQKIGIKPKKIHTLHNPLNISKILDAANSPSPYPEEDSTIRLVAVGRLANQKGFDILVEAFSKVIAKIPQCKLYIVGDTEYENGYIYTKLKKRINELGLDSKIIFTGFNSNPYNYIKNADVFILSSRYEGLPNTLIEAQLIGTPCAAVKCIPIIERIIQNGYNGFLAETENPDSLANAIYNATTLGKIKMTYKPAVAKDFIKLFNQI